MNKVLFSSNKCEWETPEWLYNFLNMYYHFTLDPCADKNNHKCDKFYTKEDNGLLQDWSGETVFCNPPYGRELYKWVEKCFCENAKNDVEIVMLIPARTDTRWFHQFIYNNNKCYIIFLKGRLKFGKAKNSAPFPSMIVVFKGGKNNDLRI